MLLGQFSFLMWPYSTFMNISSNFPKANTLHFNLQVMIFFTQCLLKKDLAIILMSRIFATYLEKNVSTLFFSKVNMKVLLCYFEAIEKYHIL